MAAGAQLQIVSTQGVTRSLPLSPAVIDLGNPSAAPSLAVHPRYGVVPYVFDPQVRERLTKWVDAEVAYSALIVSGRGGSGKTRLAVEECRRLGAIGWVTGFLVPSADRPSLEELAHVDNPRLVVADYAETQLDLLADLIPLLRDAASSDHPVRLLLLMRTPQGSSRRPGENPWLEVFRQHGPVLAAQLAEVAVKDLDEQALSTESNQILFTSAFRAFQRLSGRMELEPAYPRALDEKDPLLVVLTAFKAAYGGAGEASTLTSALDFILDHETRYWEARAQAARVELSRNGTQRVVAAATLTSAGTRDDADRVLQALPEYRDSNAERRREIIDWAHGLYPGRNYWNPLEPDLIGEHLVTRELGNETALSAICDAAQTPRPFIVLARLDLPQAPAAITVVTDHMSAMADEDVLALSWRLQELEHPEAMAAALLDRASRLTSLASQFQVDIFEDVAGHSGLRFPIRALALEQLVDQLDVTRPWRQKDWRQGSKPPFDKEPVAKIVVDLLRSSPEQTLDLLGSWLVNHQKLGRSAEVSRSDIAGAIAVRHLDRTRQRFTTWVRNDSSGAIQLLERTARHDPAALADFAQEWVRGDDDRLRTAAINAVQALPWEFAESAGLIDSVVLPLAVIKWRYQEDALRIAARHVPDDPKVRKQLFATVADGRGEARALTPYLYTSYAGQALQEFLRQPLSGRGPVIAALANWHPVDDQLEERVLQLVKDSEKDPALATAIGVFAESALNRLYSSHFVSEKRLQWALQTMAQGPETLRRPMFYPLSEPPSTDEFELYRQRFIDSYLGSEPTAHSMAVFVTDLFYRYAEGSWPTEVLLERLLEDYSTAERTEILLGAVRADPSGNAARFVARTGSTDRLAVDKRIERFRDEYVTSGDLIGAIRAAQGMDRPS